MIIARAIVRDVHVNAILSHVPSSTRRFGHITVVLCKDKLHAETLHNNLAQLTEGDENDRPPIRPPDLAASASPGAEKVTAAMVAATANFFARSAVKASHPFFPPPSPAVICNGRRDAATRAAGVGRVSADVVPAKRPVCTGINALAGPQAASKHRDAAALILRFVSSQEGLSDVVLVRWCRRGTV